MKTLRPVRPVRLFLCALVLSVPCASQRALFTADGPAGARLGFAVAAAGDVNADGYDDCVVGAPTYRGAVDETGAAFVYSGRDGSVLHSWFGSEARARFGHSVAGAGDFDGDGHGDVIVGAPEDDEGGSQAGSATVFSGRDGSVLCRMIGDSSRDLFGTSVACAGDVNADGYPDVIVGAPDDSGPTADSGSVRVYAGNRGPVLLTLFGGTAGDFGAAVDGVGDVDGDGHDDFIVGSPSWGSWTGRARLFSGRDGALLQTWTGTLDDRLGSSVVGVDDVDGDGFADVAISSPREQGAFFGSVRIYSSSTGARVREFFGPGSDRNFAERLGLAGDVDGDGVRDLAISEIGCVSVFSGADGSVLMELAANAQAPSVAGFGDATGDGRSDLIVGLWSENPGDGSVAAFAGLEGSTLRTEVGAAGEMRGLALAKGDVNGDSVADEIIGVPGEATNGVNAGAVFVRSGADGTQLHAFFGAAGERLGSAVAYAGDVNKDGFGDVLAGAPLATATNVGAARLYSGMDGTLLFEKSGAGLSDLLGSSVAGVGDVDGDGFLDLAAGGPEALGRIVIVFSGRDGSTIHSISEGHLQGFGRAVAGPGDTNGDGHADVLVGASESGVVRLYSGRDAAILFTFDGSGAADTLWPAGDFDGDGFPDFAFATSGGVRVRSGRNGAILLSATAGTRTGGLAVGDVDADGIVDFVLGLSFDDFDGLQVISGSDASVLCELRSTVRNDSLGRTVAVLDDRDGDGLRELLVGAPLSPAGGIDAGEVKVLSCRTPFAGTFVPFGRGCPKSTGGMPRIGNAGRPAIAGSFAVTLRGAPAQAAASLHVDIQAQDLDLGLIGFSGCTALALPFFAFNTGTSASGAARIDLPLPNDATLVRASLYAQWFALDLAVPTVVVSDGAVMTFGER